ncbi:nitroreductase family protein [Iamia sp.]|uniref:nitroreductase family protein n=1 Tax=Iamia sp. TaxID=2722710 RepID=UPI002C4A49A3|nr:nitroreductase family protein [Iamia sp.]HXH58653.1 nitroreductase family protein [Iamia sp.]
MALDLSPDELLSTTRSVRKRLDLGRPVPRDVVQDCIEVALQAPSGSNSQSWHWVVVTAAEKRRALAELYARHFDPYIALSEEAAPYPSGDPRADAAPRVSASARYLRDHLHEVPVHVIPCQWGRVDGADTFAQASFWGSILPAAWSFMLALRSRGLGSSWTTLHLPSEAEAAEILGLPHDKVTQAGLFPVAYTLGTDFKAASRIDSSRLVHWDTW